jgi:hypothetical protein
MAIRAGMKPGSAVKPSAKGLDRLVQCLHRYVDLNGERFDTLTEKIGSIRVVTIVVSTKKTRDEDRLLRSI